MATDDQVRELEGQLPVISTHLVGGQHEVRVYAKSSPGNEFRPVESNLEDVYFLNLSGQAHGQPLN